MGEELPSDVCLTCLQGGAVNPHRESSIHDMVTPAFRGMAHEYAPVTLTVGEPPPPAVADHAALLAEAGRVRNAMDAARSFETKIHVPGDAVPCSGNAYIREWSLLIDALAAALRRAPALPEGVSGGSDGG